MTHRRALLAAFCSALLLGLAWGCSAADNGASGSPGFGGGSGVDEAGNDEQTLSPDGSTTDPDGGIVLNALCGKKPSCVPDEPRSCVGYVPPALPAGDAGAGAGPDATEAGASGEGGASGARSSDPSAGGASGELGAAGASGNAGEAGAGGAGGESSEGGAAGAAGASSVEFGCQVQRIPGVPQTVTSECTVVGTGGANAPCLTSSDCKAGYGCVGDQNAGLCQAYCCESADNCDPGKILRRTPAARHRDQRARQRLDRHQQHATDPGVRAG